MTAFLQPKPSQSAPETPFGGGPPPARSAADFGALGQVDLRYFGHELWACARPNGPGPKRWRPLDRKSELNTEPNVRHWRENVTFYSSQGDTPIAVYTWMWTGSEWQSLGWTTTVC